MAFNTWNGAVDNDWATNGNWSLGRVPTPQDWVVFSGPVACRLTSGPVQVRGIGSTEGFVSFQWTGQLRLRDDEVFGDSLPVVAGSFEPLDLTANILVLKGVLSVNTPAVVTSGDKRGMVRVSGGDARLNSSPAKPGDTATLGSDVQVEIGGTWRCSVTNLRFVNGAELFIVSSGSAVFGNITDDPSDPVIVNVSGTGGIQTIKIGGGSLRLPFGSSFVSQMPVLMDQRESKLELLESLLDALRYGNLTVNGGNPKTLDYSILVSAGMLYVGPDDEREGRVGSGVTYAGGLFTVRTDKGILVESGGSIWFNVAELRMVSKLVVRGNVKFSGAGAPWRHEGDVDLRGGAYEGFLTAKGNGTLLVAGRILFDLDSKLSFTLKTGTPAVGQRFVVMDASSGIDGRPGFYQFYGGTFTVEQTSRSIILTYQGRNGLPNPPLLKPSATPVELAR